MVAEPLTSSRPSSLGPVLGIGLPLLLAVTLLPFGLAGRNPLWGDEGMFAYMAWAPTASGTPLYQAGHDPKPPGIFLLYQAVRGYDAAGVGRARLVVGFLAFLTAALLLVWLTVSVSPAAGLWAGALSALGRSRAAAGRLPRGVGGAGGVAGGHRATA
jgi:hypothetical protein